LPVATVALLLCGCAPQREPASSAAPPLKAAKQAVSASSEQSAEKPAEIAVLPAEKWQPPLRLTDDFNLPLVIVIDAPEASLPAEKWQPPLRLTDDFNLPLVIVIDAPEAPPEIQGPSPPIPQEPASP